MFDAWRGISWELEGAVVRQFRSMSKLAQASPATEERKRCGHGLQTTDDRARRRKTGRRDDRGGESGACSCTCLAMQCASEGEYDVAATS